jgi:hypothetical protein
MTYTFEEEPTEVPIADGRTVRIEPRQPWPSPYRGSRYSLVSDEDVEDPAIKWTQRDLTVYSKGGTPTDLWTAMTIAGKPDGFGSFRITADGEVITKVEADEYSNVDQAPVSSGWIPVYLGRLNGTFDFGTVDLDPPVPDETVAVWSGFPFNHGERWSVNHKGQLVWNWQDYSFRSAFDHSELVAAYDRYRPNPGRMYITENGHVWINVPNDGIVSSKESEIADAIKQWKRRARENGNNATLRLVNRRMVATSPTDNPSEGHLPVHLGHLSQFDQGLVPRPVVDDESYYIAAAKGETVYG